MEEAREDVIDVVGSLKFGHLADEDGAEIGGFPLLELASVGGAKAGARVGDGKAATAARRKTVLTARQIIDAIGVSDLFFPGNSFFSVFLGGPGRIIPGI